MQVNSEINTHSKFNIFIYGYLLPMFKERKNFYKGKSVNMSWERFLGTKTVTVGIYSYQYTGEMDM